MFFQITPTAEGRFSISIETPEAENFYLVVILPDGTLACSNSISFIDTDAPVVEITHPEADDEVKGTEALTYTVTGIHTLEQARIGAAAWATVVSGALISTLSGWGSAPQGAMVIQVRAIDASGNIGLDSVSVVKDTVAPTVEITGPLDDEKVKGTAALLFGTDDPGSVTEARIGTAAWAPVTTGALLSTLSGWGAAPEGAFTLAVRATDEAGNVGSDSVTPIKDTVAPVVAITAPLTGRRHKGDFLFTFDNDTPTGIIEARVGIAPYAAVVSGARMDSLSGWAGMPEGEITLNLRVTDDAGNVGSDTQTPVKDTVAPTVAILGPLTGIYVKGGAAFTFSNDDPSATVEARIGASAWAAVTSGDLMSTLSGWDGASEGTIALDLRATDPAGNIGTDTKMPKKDTIAPAITVTHPLTGDTTNGTTVITFTLVEQDPAPVIDARINGAGVWTTITTGVTTIADLPGFAGVVDHATFVLNTRGTDHAGNVGTTDVTNITKDVTP